MRADVTARAFAAIACVGALLVATACRPVAAPVDDSTALSLPRSTSDMVAGVGTEVELGTAGILVAGVRVAPLHLDDAGPDIHASSMLPSLRDALVPHAAAHRPTAPRDDLRDVPRLPMRVLADRRVVFAALAGVLQTAAEGGYLDFELAVDGNEGGASIAIAVPRYWLPPLPEGVHVCHEFPIVAELRPDGIRGFGPDGEVHTIAARAGCVPGSSACLDREALAGFAAAMKADMPHETVVTVRVDSAITVELLVATLDVLRGESCRLRGAITEGEEVPEACMFWQAIVDTLPRAATP